MLRGSGGVDRVDRTCAVDRIGALDGLVEWVCCERQGVSYKWRRSNLVFFFFAVVIVLCACSDLRCVLTSKITRGP